MSQIFNIVEDTVVIDKLVLTHTAGSVVHTGSLQVTDSVQLNNGLSVVGTITADTINVKNLITDNGGLASIGEWKYDTEVELNGKGFTWAWDNAETKLIFRTGNRLWTNANLDLAAGASYSIGDTSVLSANSLGGSIINSSLTSVGTLNELEVDGDVTLGNFAFFSSTYNRFGIGTDEPNAALSIMENNVEIIVGSPASNVATIGTYSSHDVSIVSDNIPRITAKANGEVQIGTEAGRTGVLRVYGTIFADAVQTDNRVNRTHPLEFISTVDTTVYGLGLNWVGTGATKEFALMTGTGGDRLWSTENIDLSEDKSFQIGGVNVLSASALGNGVTHSNLTSVGTLTSLTVDGAVTLNGSVTLDTVHANSITFGNVSIGENGFSTTDTITIGANNVQVLYANSSQISIGDSSRADKPVKVFGPLSVGINNPDPDVNFSVNGDVKIGGKKFTNGLAAPTSGTYAVGDICWNTRPQATSYVGWVCVAAGDPGEWLPFGGINIQ